MDELPPDGLHSPPGATGDGLVLTHGAGGNRDAPLLVAVATAFAAVGLTVLRYDLPFRQARPHGPPPPGSATADRDGLQRAVAAMRRRCAGRVFLGGHSYGGRQASILAASAPGLVDGLLLLAYPLHPPRRPAEIRTAHFGDLRTPTVFVHGSADPFGSLGELETARALIPAPSALIAVDGARHDLHGGRPSAAARVARMAVEALLALARP